MNQHCAELRRVTTQKLLQTTPPLGPTGYGILFHQVSDRSQFTPNLYVIEVRVPAPRGTSTARKRYLFSAGRGEVYVKTDAGKKPVKNLNSS